MTARDPELQALLDREAIRDLPLRYCDCVWREDVGGLLDLFAKDGEFTIVIDGKKTTAKGRAALRKAYRQGLKIGPRPYIHNHVIELLGPDRATGRCYLDLRSVKQQMEFLGAGHYVDTYVKERGQWRFARRLFTALRIDESPVATPAKSSTRRQARR
jgi:hypothetical protein